MCSKNPVLAYPSSILSPPTLPDVRSDLVIRNYGNPTSKPVKIQFIRRVLVLTPVSVDVTKIVELTVRLSIRREKVDRIHKANPSQPNIQSTSINTFINTFVTFTRNQVTGHPLRRSTTR